MIHFIPESSEEASELPGPYAEAVARLASIRQALACVEQFSGDEASESMAEAKLAAAWPGSSPAKQRVYETRSLRAAAAAAAGLEMLSSLQQDGRHPHAAALERLKRELRDGIGDIDLLFSL
jgi:hypothetical protein